MPPKGANKHSGHISGDGVAQNGASGSGKGGFGLGVSSNFTSTLVIVPDINSPSPPSFISIAMTLSHSNAEEETEEIFKVSCPSLYKFAHEPMLRTTVLFEVSYRVML